MTFQEDKGRWKPQGRDTPTQVRGEGGGENLRLIHGGSDLELSLKGPIRIWQVRKGDEWRVSTQYPGVGKAYWQLVLMPGAHCACMSTVMNDLGQV